MSGTEERAPAALHLDDSRCADLVLGLVPEPERAAALDHAARCPGCEARLRAHAAAAERARADWRARPIPFPAPGEAPAAGAADKAPSPAVEPRRGTAERRWWRQGRFIGLAAAALAIAVAIPLARQRAYGPAATPWLTVPGEEVRTREGEGSDPHLEAGLEAYRALDLEAAERELEAARTRGGAEQLRRIVLAHVRLERGDPRAALELLRGVDWRLVPEPWRREGVTLLARALRGSGERSAADSIERALRTLAPGAPFVP